VYDIASKGMKNGSPTKGGATNDRRRVLRMGAASALACTLPLRAFAELSSEEVSTYHTHDLDWADAWRQRSVPVRLYMPDAGRPVPLVVFSHGIGGSRFGYTWLGRNFARHGIASLHLQHVGSDRQLWAGNIFSIIGRLQTAAQEREAIARAGDLRFALDTLLMGDLAPRIDAERVIAAGHSYGANTTLLVSGAKVERDGKVIDLRDDRVRAAIAISAPPFYGEGEPRKILQPVTVPSLHVTCTEDVIRIPGFYSGADDRVAVFDAIGSARKWLAVYQGGSHSMFTDRGNSGGALNPLAKLATGALAVAFVRTVIDRDERDISTWRERHASLLARFSEGGAVWPEVHSGREEVSHAVSHGKVIQALRPAVHS
jgi:predicted dienelactone hydrolase